METGFSFFDDGFCCVTVMLGPCKKDIAAVVSEYKVPPCKDDVYRGTIKV